MNHISPASIPSAQARMAAHQDPIPQSWLQAYPHGVMVEYTSKCNLRCKYCTKSNPGDDQIPGRDMDMSSQTLGAVLDCLAVSRFQEILLAGTGESTFHPNWLEDFPKLIRAGKSANPACHIHVNSNFAIKYEDAHWAVLAQLDGIVISIDTIDRDLTREVRAKSDLGLIIYNIIRFKAYCDTRSLKFPVISVNVTLYQNAAAGLPELITLLASLPITHVAISDLVETECARMYGIRQINADERAPFVSAVAYVQQAINRAQTLGRFTLGVQAHLMQRINTLVAATNQSEEETNAAMPPKDTDIEQPRAVPQSTKICLQPWTRFTVAADASIYPCCVTDMTPVGSLAASSDRELNGFNGVRMQQFRHALLVGDVPPVCIGCANASNGPVTQLQQSVQTLAETR
jgi:MoaA/NifB/PqqE/SkfB family radical SAM enzyme